MPRFASSFRVTHRFTRPLSQGDFGDLLSDGFGIDNGAQIGLEYRFGIMSGTQIGFHRTSDRTIRHLKFRASIKWSRQGTRGLRRSRRRCAGGSRGNGRLQRQCFRNFGRRRDFPLALGATGDLRAADLDQQHQPAAEQQWTTTTPSSSGVGTRLRCATRPCTGCRSGTAVRLHTGVAHVSFAIQEAGWRALVSG